MVNRGSVILVAMKGDYGKVRPAVVVQAEQSTHLFDSVTLCLITSEKTEDSIFRVQINPSDQNGLKRTSWVQSEKLMTIPQLKAGRIVGLQSQPGMDQVDLALATHLNLYALAKPTE